MKLHCKIISGYRAGQDQELDQDTIRISRSDAADIQLHPVKDLQAGSKQHAEIVRGEDNYIVKCLHPNGLTLKTAGDTTELAEGEEAMFTGDAELTVGKDGPRIRCITIDATIPGTLRGAAPELRKLMPVADVASETVAKAEKSTARILAIGVVAVLLVACLGIGVFYTFKATGDRTDQQFQGVEDEIAGTQNEANQLRGDTERLSEGLVEARNSDAALNERLSLAEQARTALEDALRNAEGSVYIAGLIDGDAFRFIGTAWVVGDGGVLATNAHVAEKMFGDEVREEFGDAYGRSVFPVIRKPGEESPDLRVTSCEIHPGYARWRNAPAWIKSTGDDYEFAQQALAFDVALLRVQDTERQLGEPLRLLDGQEVLSIQKGSEIGYVGYPVERQPGLRTSRSASIVTGRITSLLHPLGIDTDIADMFIVQHNATTAGGSSGSPILNESGHVVAIHNAGSYVFTGQGRASQGINYAQRIDLLQELLDGTANQNQRVRDERMLDIRREAGVTGRTIVDARVQATLTSIVQSKLKEWTQEYMDDAGVQSQYDWHQISDSPAYKQALAEYRSNLLSDIEAEQIGDFEFDLEQEGAEHGWDTQITLEPGYFYLITAASDGLSDIDLRLYDGNTIEFSRERSEPAPYLWGIHANSNLNRTVQVFAKSLAGVDRHVTVRIVRFKQ